MNSKLIKSYLKIYFSNELKNKTSFTPPLPRDPFSSHLALYDSCLPSSQFC